MADEDDYCDNCDGPCDGCCGGPNKKYPTKEDEAKLLVKTIMTYGNHVAEMVLEELKKQLAANK